MDEVLIIGAGGHGREIALIIEDINKARPSLTLRGFIDDDPELIGKDVMRVQVIGNLESLINAKDRPINLIMGIGNPTVKKTVFNKVNNLFVNWPSLVHPSAKIARNARLGKGVVVFPNCVVSTDTDIGDHCCLNTGVSVSHDSQIGRFSTINPGCYINGESKIGESVYIGSSAVIINRINVGDLAVIGAGAVVIKDIPSNTTSVGNPSRVINVHYQGGE